MKSKRLNVRYLNKMDNFRLFDTGDDDLRYPLIIDGQLDDDVLEIIDRDEEWVKAELEKQNITIEQVYIGEYLNGQLIGTCI